MEPWSALLTDGFPQKLGASTIVPSLAIAPAGPVAGPGDRELRPAPDLRERGRHRVGSTASENWNASDGLLMSAGGMDSCSCRIFSAAHEPLTPAMASAEQWAAPIRAVTRIAWGGFARAYGGHWGQ